jgi:hypothetical protein
MRREVLLSGYEPEQLSVGRAHGALNELGQHHPCGVERIADGRPEGLYW